MKTVLVLLVIVSVGAASFAAGKARGKQFSDVPSDHWAASAVQQMSDEGVMSGYPDSTFKGDKPVTRYELAVALARFAEFMEAGRKPLVSPEQKPQSKTAVKKSPKWAKSSVNYLTSNLFLPADSPIIMDGDKPATSEDVAQALTSFSATYIKRNVKDAGPTEE